MLPAPIVFSLVCLVLNFWITMTWAAWGMGNFRAMVLDIANTRARVVIQPGVFNRDFPDIVLFARKVDPLRGTLSGVIVDDRARSDGNVLILAPDGGIETDPSRGEIVFRLRGGNLYNFRGETSTLIRFDEYIVRLDLAKIFRGLNLGAVKPREMPWKTLAAFDLADLMGTDPALARKIDVEKQLRRVYPAACLALTLFVLPLASMFEGLHRQWGLAVALGCFFIYYSLLSMGISMGESGAIAPVVGLWLPNVLFCLAGVYGIRMAAKERAPHVVDLLRELRRRRTPPRA
jgi:lipopolysaccharide export system permease protein